MRLATSAHQETLVASTPPASALPPPVYAFPSAQEPPRSRAPLYILAGLVLIVLAASVVGGALFLYLNNRPQKPATLRFADGTRYEGEQKNSKPHGRGIMLFPTGDVYDGDFRDGKREGSGVYTFKTGVKYTGQFKDDVYNGHGKLEFPNQDVYEGEFRDGNYNGRGTFTFHDGRQQTGTWVDGKLTGP
jgi:hypothetical protein